ncbi:MAG: hypothetical protein PWR27_542 [Petroclostridium sp.]|jgi:hypothetical protein|uniref:hypothetical protein n=1 Tax=Petroclostridium xylanilyticum TaxID=1792311 RepID=UPI000B99559D|nr:hypothetical protein [Petroclostridium xylanilyticum]MBZ4646956.1 hypothetical protein [Clostridia bacterium]MDK2809833.1 hypothetical protein [Petroclostridium sp.]
MVDFQARMKQNISQAKERLDSDFMGSKEAMLSLAVEKVRQFQIASDTVFENEEKEILTLLIVGSMFQAFSYGYGIGKVEGETLQKVIL